jgi:hypothetical protein
MPIFAKKLAGTKSSPAQIRPVTKPGSYRIEEKGGSLEYQPLDSARNEIRLVRLKCGYSGFLSDFQFDILKVSISDAPPYKALSYAWGEGSESVSVPTKYGSCRVSDTLKRFFEQAVETKEDSQAYYWVDAICIDQSNVTERNEQVLRMKEIYEAAERIVVWLDAPHISLSDSMLLSTTQPVFLELGARTYLERDTLAKIYECAWWKRAWIIQEASTPAVRNKSQSVVMWIGRYRCHLDACLKAWEKLREMSVQGGVSHRLPPMVDDLAWIRAQRANSASRLEIYDLLPRVRRCEASDMRDKIYSILAISCDYDAKDLKPEYSKPTGEVYTSLVRYLIERDQKLDILAYCTAGRNIESLPSWVPGKTPS